MSPAPAETAQNRGLITVSIMLATLMQSLDTTIANVALPHMQGSLQASSDQITWVLTSYIIAAAVMTPMVPWLAGRFGTKRVLLVSIVGFTLSSMACGLAQNLPEMVLFRLSQGIFGASLMPLSQTVLFDINPVEKHGSAMAIWAMGALIGPIVGPALGGWLTDNYDWRWVFYINVPGGILAFLGVWTFFHGRTGRREQKFDFFGFTTLVIALAAFQLMLDRGQSQDWFQSREIWIEASVAAVAFYMFVLHTVTAEHPFFDKGLARDRNFVAATVGMFFVMAVLFSVLSLLPPMLERLMGYPVVTTGLVTMPRGVGMFLVMPIIGRVMGKIDSRLIVALGLLISSASLYAMSKFSLDMDSHLVIMSGFFQGVAMGLIFVPMSTVGFATLAPHLRAEGSAVFTLIRNIGSAIGISVMQALLVSNSFKSHSVLVEHLRPDNPAMASLPHALDMSTPFGAAMLNGMVTRQASMIAYVSDFRLMALVNILVLPLLLLLRRPASNAKADVLID